jgi:glycosyltransferase involved in cell wall biosynthesis
MASGVPTVMTPLPAQAFSGIAGEHYLVADTDETFAGALVGLLRDPGRRERLGRASREYVLAHHSWARATGALVAAYEAARGDLGTGTPTR